jgi:hypothetical protein
MPICPCAGRCRSCWRMPPRARSTSFTRWSAQGSRELSRQPVGARLSLMGPIGHGFTPLSSRPRPLLIGGGVGIPPIIFLADVLRRSSRCTLASAGADGLRDPVPVPGTAVHAPDSGYAGRRDCLHAAARGLGSAQPPREPGGVSGVLRGLRHFTCRGVARKRWTQTRGKRSRSTPAAPLRCSR